MTDSRSIVVSGDLGSGKSTVTALLADRLGIRRMSMGDIYRDMARKRGMSALQLNLHSERDETVDDRIDQLQADIAKTGERLIVDSRLAWHFFADAFKVHLLVDPIVAAERVMSRPSTQVESYSSTSEAVARLQARNESERARFIKKYGIDKARLRNYDMICDTTRAPQREIVSQIVKAFNGILWHEVLSQSPPLLLLDPARIYPSRDIQGLKILSDAGFVAVVVEDGIEELKPISIAYANPYFYVVDGHRRLSAALQGNFTLIAGRLVAEAEEKVEGDLSARQYFQTKVSPAMIYNWETAHRIKLPRPSISKIIAQADVPDSQDI
jgi:cytidylate kinase